MNKKIIFFAVCSVVTLSHASDSNRYELIPSQDVEKSKTPPYGFSSMCSSSDSSPDRTVHDFDEPVTMYIRRAPLTRNEILWRASKYTIGSLAVIGLGIGSYFLAENITHEENKVNDYLHGINQSLTSITGDINELYNLTAKILEKLSGL